MPQNELFTKCELVRPAADTESLPARPENLCTTHRYCARCLFGTPKESARCQDLSPQRCFPGLVLVRLTIGDEELLAARETILLRRRFAIQGSDVSVVGGSNPAKVGNVLPQSLSP